ncbi:phosphoribosyltransferase [Candidatus Micrarchaeota archaeon]|nr:MAG: phosphoribosyltransferase [Candidatus Micrarchaeota archaeon]
MKLLKLTWPEVQNMCEQLAVLIKNSGFEPDVIVGIARGGWVPARILSDFLDHEQIASMRVEFYTKPGETKKKPKITQKVSTAIKGKRVLLVDDVSDSGNSLKLARESLKGAKEVRTATLHFKPGSIFKPDYYIGETSDWIVYPWEAKETERKLKER